MKDAESMLKEMQAQVQALEKRRLPELEKERARFVRKVLAPVLGCVLL
jgi:hypothetical protein